MSSGELVSADARNFRPSAIRALAPLMADPAVISFAGGTPSPETFPAAEIADCAVRALRERKQVALQYGPTRGLPRLREFIAGICRSRGLDCAVENVMVTTGSQQALSLISHVLLDPGDVVLVELPTYIGGTSAFHGRRAELIGVAQDDDGLVPSSLEEVAESLRRDGKRIKFLYAIPNFQNPSGRLMQQDRRDAVVQITRRHHIRILEDDPYGELVYAESADTTPMAARGREGVIYLGTFSKVLAPGLRCGWIVADQPILKTIELAKEAADLCSGMLDQSIVEEFCLAGLLPDQIGRVRRFYRERRDVLLGALQQHFHDRASWTEALGGLFTFVTLADSRDTREWLPRAIEQKVSYVPGGPFFVDGSGANTMRLTFAKEPDDRMREGIRRLARLFFE